MSRNVLFGLSNDYARVVYNESIMFIMSIVITGFGGECGQHH